MEPQQSTQTQNDQIAELGQRMARMETRMEFVATHKDLAEVRTEATKQRRTLFPSRKRHHRDPKVADEVMAATSGECPRRGRPAWC